MYSHDDGNKPADRPRYHRYNFLSAPAILFLAVINARATSAFPTPLSHRPLSVKGGSHSINHKSISGCSSYAGFKDCTEFPSNGRRSMSSVILQAYQKEQKEFQRSLLEAKIANDIKSTNVKEEKQRNEVVAKQIDQEKEELRDAAKEVKEAAKGVSKSAKNLGGAVISNTTEVIEAVQEVSQSAKNLGGAFISRVPILFTRLCTLLATSQMRNDILRRRKYYVSDWTDAFKKKRQVIPAVLFLYFACLAPAVSFGTISSEITNGSMGVVEFLLGSGFAGMLYSIFCGQPMAFVAPTGLTLAFISGLFRFCKLSDLPFFPVYAWVGLWTSAFMTLLGLIGASKLIRFCTRFTDEVFNGMLSVNFLYEAFSSLRRNFVHANPMNLTMPFVALSMALGTFFGTMKVVKFEATKFFSSNVRKIIKNFGPVSMILLFTLLNLLPWAQKFHVPTLSVPDTLQLAGGRSFLVGLKDIPVNIRLLCAFPACLLTCLFFMDQNISVRLVNNPDNKLKKGAAYNLDMVALGMITGVLSIFGLPWMCGATVQSMNHVRAMAETELNEETNQMEITEVTETRLTGFIIHAMLASTVLLLPVIKNIPIPVVSGVFLFLGRKLMTGNTFFQRITDGFAERARLPDKNPIHLLGRKKMNIYTGVQVLCLLGLFGFKQIPSITIFFPVMIGVLMSIRAFVLPKFFNEEEFDALGDQTPQIKRSKSTMTSDAVVQKGLQC
eukprot:CAMPEP_0172312864 /NCGR_PEP_ID=MMETSP1058-20130122/18699_1 /TAXON_ID=83371 /ORGANISM="Detonula confervacea, Strain CCMP 353" /LENGTH=723 /DNA_ID=CAMNT_0013026419 /DNA_START=227 /DNA_END=2398 /DNA_ORIENTATION=-